MSQILVVKSARTGRYEVKYMRGQFHRTVECSDDPADAAANALDVRRRLFGPGTRIVAGAEVMRHIGRNPHV